LLLLLGLSTVDEMLWDPKPSAGTAFVIVVLEPAMIPVEIAVP
jgi:hypothetical protein